MKDNKIIFNDIELAKKHLINIWDNPLEWWNSKKILSIRSEFQRVCSLKTKDDFSEWYNFLKIVRNFGCIIEKTGYFLKSMDFGYLFRLSN